MGRIELRGQSGDIRWGYLSAATVGPWTVSQDGDGAARLTAQLLQQDAFRIAQTALTFRVDRPSGPWIWKIASISIADQTLTASLGPQE
jgi:hypothetical protein